MRFVQPVWLFHGKLAALVRKPCNTDLWAIWSRGVGCTDKGSIMDILAITLERDTTGFGPADISTEVFSADGG